MALTFSLLLSVKDLGKAYGVRLLGGCDRGMVTFSLGLIGIRMH